MYSRRLLPGYALGLAALASCGAASAKGLYPTPFFQTLNSPAAVVSADVNGDGHPDLIELGSDGTVSVSLNNGDGTFKRPAVYYVAGDGPEAIAAADLRHDGKIDIVVVNGTDNTVSVLLGNGDGTFQAQSAVEQAHSTGTPAPTYPVGNDPLSVTIADVNGDGKLDILVANFLDNNVSVLLGNGDGTFKPQTTVAVGIGPVFITTADLNKDGKADLLVNNNLDDTLGVLLGNGDGTFQAMTSTKLGPKLVTSTLQMMVTGDFNRDGNIDVITTITSSNSQVAYYLAGNGDGSFRTARSLFTGLQTTYLATADVNGDGMLDLIAGSLTNNTVRVMFGNANGGFTAGQDYPANGISGATNIQGLVADDFSGTGKPDIAVVNTAGSFMQLLYNDGTGQFHLKNSYATGDTPTDVQSADLNGDHHLDLVEVNSVDGNLGVRLGNGDGTFQAMQTYKVGANPQRVLLVDVNGDGKLDAVTLNAGDGTVSVLLGNGDGTFQAARNFDAGPNPVDLAAGDMDQDGKLDLVVANAVVNTVSILRGNGNGTFQARKSYLASAVVDGLAVGDVNHDGFPDVVTVGSNVAVLKNDGKGGLIQPVLNKEGLSVDLYATIGVRVVLADVTGEGNLDILVADSSDSQLAVLLGNRLGFFLPAADFPTCGNPRSLTVADLNADGKPDVVVSCSGSSAVGVLLGNGKGGFLSAPYPAEINPRGVAIGDFDEDGQPDLAVVNGDSDILNVLTQIHGIVASDKAPKTLNGTLFVPNGTLTQSGNFLAFDPDGDPLTYVAIDLPQNGTFTYSTADGSYSYLANTDFVGSDSMTFQVTDGVKLSNISTVAITVQSNSTGSSKGHSLLGGFWLPLLPLLGLLGLARRRRRG